MNELQTFNFESRAVRTIAVDGELWWVAKDVAEALEYPEATISNTAKMVQHVPDEWKGRYPIPTPGGTQNMLCLTEQGLYFFLARSDKPRAFPFQKWIAGEVLPSIRKTGKYTAWKSALSFDHRLINALNTSVRIGAITGAQFRAILSIPSGEAAPVNPAPPPCHDLPDISGEVRKKAAFLSGPEAWYPPIPVIQAFIDERCIREGSMNSRAVQEVFYNWQGERGVKSLIDTQHFFKYLGLMGYATRTRSKVYTVEGLSLRPESPAETPEAV